MESLPHLKEALLELEPGVSGFFGALRNEHLRCLAQNWEDREVVLLHDFLRDYLNGNIDHPWFFKVWGLGNTVAFFKTPQKDPTELRPVGIKASLPRFAHKVAIRAQKGLLQDYLGWWAQRRT